MSEFTVRGRLAGDDVSVTWADARVTGSPAAVAAVHEVLRREDTVALSPQSAAHPATERDPAAVLAATQGAFDEITSVEGDYPMPEADSSAS